MSHFVFVGFPVWGHSRPLLSLALNLVSSHPELSITFISAIGFASHLHKEIGVFYGPETPSPRLNIITIGEITESATLDDIGPQMVALLGGLPGALASIVALDPGGQGINRRPSLVVGDAFLPAFIDILHSCLAGINLKKDAIPAYLFCPVTAAAMIEHFGDEGHFNHIEAKAQKLVEKGVLDPTNKGPLELLAAAHLHFEDKILHFPGTASLYEYELQPQLDCIPLAPPIVGMLVGASAQIKKASGMVLPSTSELEPGAREALEKSLGRPVLQVGPQFSDRVWNHTYELETSLTSASDKEVTSFLDSCAERYGPKSVLYISFGSIFFPTARPDLVSALINSLLTASPPIPFVFGLAGCPSELSAELETTLQDKKELALLTKFAPQMTVLRHPGTGWFLTHGGSNSMYESILHGMPLVTWPMSADQPMNCAHLSQVLKIAYELVQVRNGPSIGKPTARGITPTGKLEDLEVELRETWRKTRGEEGLEVRRRMGEVSAILKGSWERGESRKAMEALSKFL